MAAMAGMAGSAGKIGGGIVGGIASFLLAKKEAERLKEMGITAAEERRREGAKLIGAQRAAFAKAGVKLEGTALDVLAETAETEELEALRVQFEFDLAARSKKIAGIAALGGGLAMASSAAGSSLLDSARTRTSAPASSSQGNFTFGQAAGRFNQGARPSQGSLLVA